MNTILRDGWMAADENYLAGSRARADDRRTGTSRSPETAHNLIIDQARSSRRTIPLEAADWLRPDLHSSILGLENRIMFERILDSIQSDVTEDQRHVVILRYLEGFSLRETAAIMGITVAPVKVIQNRAIAKIRQALNYDEIMTTVSCTNVRKLSKALSI